MLDLLLKVADRVIELLQIRERRMRARFEQVHAPSYAELQAVHTDYLQLITSVSLSLGRLPQQEPERNRATAELLDLLRVRRLQLRPVRQKLIALGDLLWGGESAYKTAYSDFPPEEQAFLESLIRYFEVSGVMKARGSTPLASLIDAIESKLMTSVSLTVDASRGPGAPSATISHVRGDCERAIATLEQSWSTTTKCFNTLRVLCARHA